MCRLFAITNTAMDSSSKISIMERAILMAMLDDRQEDGTGFSDGDVVWKTKLAAHAAKNEWQGNLDPSKPWIGHVRKKSYGTGVSDLEAHPFKFITESGSNLVLAHNGYFHGTSYAGFKPGDPTSDTFRAGRQLLETVNRANGIIDASVLELWLSDFEEGSAYSLLIMLDGKLYVVRGHDRPLHVAKLGLNQDDNTYMVSTSDHVLAIMQDYIRNRMPHLYVGESKELLEDSVLEFDINGVLNSTYRLTYQLLKKTFGITYTGGHSHDPVVGTTYGGSSRGPKGGSTGKGESTSIEATPSVTSIASNVPGGNVSYETTNLIGKALTFTIDWLHNALHPMSAEMINLWFTHLSGLTIPLEELSSMNLYTNPGVNQYTLDEFIDNVVMSADDDIFWKSESQIAKNPLLSTRQMVLLTKWNDLVDSKDHVSKHTKLFGNDLMWVSSIDCSFSVLDLDCVGTC